MPWIFKRQFAMCMLWSFLSIASNSLKCKSQLLGMHGCLLQGRSVVKQTSIIPGLRKNRLYLAARLFSLSMQQIQSSMSRHGVGLQTNLQGNARQNSASHRIEGVDLKLFKASCKQHPCLWPERCSVHKWSIRLCSSGILHRHILTSPLMAAPLQMSIVFIS